MPLESFVCVCARFEISDVPFCSCQTIITAMSCALCTQKHKHHKLNPNAMPTPSGNNNNNENISVEKVIKSGHNVILASFPIRITVEQHRFKFKKRKHMQHEIFILHFYGLKPMSTRIFDCIWFNLKISSGTATVFVTQRFSYPGDDSTCFGPHSLNH